MQGIRTRIQSVSNARVLLLTLLLSSVLFGLNYFHQDQQGGIFYGRYLVLSESIREFAYSYQGQTGAVATYPIWGYPVLMAVLDPLLGIQGVYVLQYVLLLASFWLVYRFFDIPGWDNPFETALFHGALIAYAMFLSVKWPMAIVAFLLLVFGLLHQRGRYGLASLTLLLAIHFRFEALLMWGIYVVFLLVESARGHIRYRELLRTRKNLYQGSLLVICSLFLLTSWPLYQYSQHGQLLLGTSNSGGTLYSGLGQLPNNPWNRVFADKSATDYARSQGVQDAWGLEGNRVLTRRFLQDVSEHPPAFLAKVLYNQLRILTGGFYISELRTLSVRRNPDKDEEQKALFAQYKRDIPSLFADMLALKMHTYTMLSQLVLKILSVLLLLGLLGTLVFRIARGGGGSSFQSLCLDDRWAAPDDRSVRIPAETGLRSHHPVPIRALLDAGRGAAERGGRYSSKLALGQSAGMKVSIVIPVLNDLRIGRALDSVLSQQHEHELELIVIDAGSTDGTLEVLERYRDRVTVLVSGADEGIYDGMNKGIGLATGDVVGILNADDRYSDPLVLRDVMDTFTREDVDACYGDLVYTNEAGKMVRYWKSGDNRRWRLGWMPPHPTFFARRRVYERYGAFDLRYPISADYELMLRLMLKHKIEVKYMDRVLVHMAPGGNSGGSLSTIMKANLEVARAWRNNGLSGGLLAPVLKPARKIFQVLPLRLKRRYP